MAIFLAKLFPILLAAALLAAGCEDVAVSTPAPTTITIVGSAAMQRALRQLADEFQRQNPNVLFSIRGGGSTIGEAEIAQGEADIAASTLLPPVEDAAGPGDLVRTPVGINGLAIVVHPSNSVSDLSLVQLRDIFSGSVLNWQALGSDNGEIQLVSREDGSGSRILFEDRVMGAERVSLTAVVMPSSADVAAYVAKRPDAIGYVSRGEVASLLAAGADDATPQQAPVPALDWPPVKSVRVEGQLPTVENLVEQRYALIQPLYLVTRGAPAGWSRRFIDFALSPAGQAIIGQFHAPIR